MLLNLREILEPAVKDNFAVGGFNVTESTMFKAIVEEAQYREAPAIIQVSPNEFQFSERELYLYFSVRLQRSRNPLYCTMTTANPMRDASARSRQALPLSCLTARRWSMTRMWSVHAGSWRRPMGLAYRWKGRLAP